MNALYRNNLPALLYAAALALLTGNPASAQNCPGNAVRLVVPYAPGGGTEMVVRTVASKLTEVRGSYVVVDNRGGASGNIAMELVARATANGCTLLFGHSSPLTINPSLYKSLPVDTVKDFAPISLLGSVQFLLVVHRSVPANSVDELIKLLKAKPGDFPYASGGAGSPAHLATELFKMRAGVDMTHVPYKGGGPAQVALLSGEVKLFFSSFATSIPHLKTGVIKALAVTGPKRSSSAPEVATMQELGFANFDVRAWYGILAPAGTPRPVVSSLNRDLVNIVASPEVSDSFRKGFLDPMSSTPEEFASYIREQKALWAKVVAAVGLKPE